MSIPGTFGSDLPVDEEVTDPLDLLGRWLAYANTPEHPLATLSTVGLDGYPDARNLLASAYDGGRIHFHTDATSRKAAELTATPRATMTFVWPDAGRQVVVTGDVARETEAEAAAAYRERSRYLQVLAWANTDALAAEPTDARRARWAEVDARGQLDPPPTWTGFALTPLRIVFWRADPDGPSNRVLCERTADGWDVTRRAG